MKWIAVAIIAAALAACSSDTKPESGEPTESATTVTTEAQPTKPLAPTATATPNPKPKLGATTEAKGSKYTVNEVRDNLPPTRFASPPAGKRWVAIDVTQEGVTASDSFNQFYFGLQDDKAFRHQPALVIGGPEPRLSSGALQPGEQVRGWVTFEVDAAAVIVSVLAQPEPVGGAIVIADLTQ